MPWLVAMTSTHARARAELERAGFESYTPLIKEKRCIRGRRRWLIGYLFGRYFFIRHAEHWPQVLTMRHIDDLIRHDDGEPPVVPDHDITALRAREVGGFIAIKRGFAHGQKVRAKSGLLMGHVGIYAGMLHNDRECAIFDFMGQQSRVEFAPGILSAA